MHSPKTLAYFTISAVVKALILSMMTCMITGCTGSIHPLLTENELVEDMDISGEWDLELVGTGTKKQKVALKMEMYDTSTYEVSIISEQSDNETQRKRNVREWPDAWTLQIGKIDGHLFAQMIPRDAPSGPPLTNGIPVYVFGRLEVEADIVKFYGVLDRNAAAIADRCADYASRLRLLV